MSLENAFETGRLYGPLKQLAEQNIGHQLHFLSLPGLAFYTPMNAVTSSGPRELLGNIAWTVNGTPEYSVSNLAGCLYLPTGSDYLNVNDSAFLDFSGSETNIEAAYRGFSCGAWVKVSTLGATLQPIVTKFGASGNYSWALEIQANNKFVAVHSGNGTSNTTATSTTDPVTGTWMFAAMVYVPSTSISIFVNGHKTTSASTIASLYNSATGVYVGKRGNITGAFIGYVADLFACKVALSDDIVNSLYTLTSPRYA